MRNCLVAIDPMELKGARFERFCEKIHFLQEKGFVSRTFVAAVTHRSQYLMPYSYYRDHKDELAKEARVNVKQACEGRFEHETVRVLQSDSHTNEELVSHLSRHGKRIGSDILVIASNDRTGLPYWFLGSFAETASLTATMPVLILKNSTPIAKLTQKPLLVVPIDVSTPPDARDVTWIANLSRSTKSHLSLVYVEPRRRAVVDSLQERKSKDEAALILNRVATALKSKGAISTTTRILAETRSIAHAIVDFAEKEKSWMTIATSPKRKKLRKLLLGSTARHVLALSKRPFLSLRLS